MEKKIMEIFEIVEPAKIIQGHQEIRGENPIPAESTLIESEARKITVLPHRPFDNKESGFVENKGVYEIEGQPSKNSKLKSEKDYKKNVENRKKLKQRHADDLNEQREQQERRASEQL